MWNTICFGSVVYCSVRYVVLRFLPCIIHCFTVSCSSSPASSQQCSGSSAAGRVRDPRSSQNPPQPGDPVRLSGPVWGGRSSLQTGSGRSGENIWTRSSWCSHHAQHSRPRLQVCKTLQLSNIYISLLSTQLTVLCSLCQVLFSYVDYHSKVWGQ